jgi:16S rRNA G966 N2-methylase RsmD
VESVKQIRLLEAFEGSEIEEDWDFASANTQYMTHGLHPYPARMIPQIARRLIIRYTKPGPNTVVLDPFAGSGGVLVEASLKLPSGIVKNVVGARKSIGIDINPLALLLSKAKTTPVEPSLLDSVTKNLLKKVKDEIELYERGKLQIEPPYFFNIDFWFKPKVKHELQIIRENINAIVEEHGESVEAFLKVCFSKTIRESSNIRSREFKLFRIPKEELTRYNPNVYQIFKNNIEKGVKCMKEYYNACEKSEWARPKILDEDTRKKTSIPEESVNLVVTSPPYGDSRTTVAYGQFSRLSMQWLDIDGRRSQSVDKRSLGGIRTKTLSHNLESATLSTTLGKIASQDSERAKDVLSFFVDLDKCLGEISRVMMGNGRVCIVIGNRSVKGVRIPTDQIIIELAERHKLSHEKTYQRNIPLKRMPWENSPSNIPGEKRETIHREHIIVLKKI